MSMFTDWMNFFPAESLHITIWMVMCSTWVLLGLFAYLNYHTRRYYFTLWTAGWLFYSLWILAYVWSSQGWLLAEWEWVKLSCLGICAVYLFWGTLQFSGHPRKQGELLFWIGVMLIWGLVSKKLMKDSLWAMFPMFMVLGIASFVTAYYFLQRRINDQFVGASMLGLGFALWGVAMLIYPFMESSVHFRLPAFLFASMVQLIIAMGMIVLMLEEVRGETQLLQDQVKADARLTHDLQKELKVFKRKYDGILKNAMDSICTVDPLSLQILEANRALENMTGYTRLELMQLRLINICPVLRDQEKEISADPEFLQKFFGQQGNVTIQRKDHNVVVAEGSAVVLNYTHGQILQVFLRELTPYYRLEQQLRQAEKVSALGQLMSGMAHELNNPLAVISGYAQLISMRGGVNEKTQGDLVKIHKESERASRTVQNFLRFARKTPMDKANVNLNKLLDSSLELMDYDIRSSGVRVVKEYHMDLPRVFGDPNQLQQVLLNLMKNGIEAMMGSSREKVLLLRTIATASHVKVQVQDHGLGIPPEMVDRIFDPMNLTASSLNSGRGLGLSVSFHIVKDHSGCIMATQLPEGGSEFTVELPISTVKVEGEKEKGNKSPAGAPITSLPRTYSVLVVDDEESIHGVFSELLSDYSCKVEGAVNGMEALELIKRAKYDVIISDLKMPVMDGRWLYEKIKESHPELSRRIVFITGDTNSQRTTEFLEKCGNRWITKPFNFQEVETVIMEHIGRIQKEESTVVKPAEKPTR